MDAVILIDNQTQVELLIRNKELFFKVRELLHR